MSRGIKIKGNEHIYKKYCVDVLVWKGVKETNLNTDFYFCKYCFVLINYKETYAQYKCVSCWI